MVYSENCSTHLNILGLISRVYLVVCVQQVNFSDWELSYPEARSIPSPFACEVYHSCPLAASGQGDLLEWAAPQGSQWC